MQSEHLFNPTLATAAFWVPGSSLNVVLSLPENLAYRHWITEVFCQAKASSLPNIPTRVQTLATLKHKLSSCLELFPQAFGTYHRVVLVVGNGDNIGRQKLRIGVSYKCYVGIIYHFIFCIYSSMHFRATITIT